jgi:hypothetical protein
MPSAATTPMKWADHNREHLGSMAHCSSAVEKSLASRCSWKSSTAGLTLPHRDLGQTKAMLAIWDSFRSVDRVQKSTFLDSQLRDSHMLRTTKDDEGCDSECGLCGHWLLTGRCSHCGWIRPCCGCGAPATATFANETHESSRRHVDLVFMCGPCAKHAFEIQNDDARSV